MDINTYGNSGETSPRKEFIDHSLLTPDYIHHSSTFYMDLIENQIGYSKNQTNSNGLHYFPMINKSESGESVPGSSLFSDITPPMQISTEIPEPQSLNYKSTNNLVTLEQDYKYVTAPNEKTFDVSQVSTVHSLPLLTDSNVIIGETEVHEDIASTRFARKVLPHKKRISRKLKTIPDEERLQFTCEICGHCAISQLDFFAHLKEHYEPSSSNMIENIETNKSCPIMGPISKKTAKDHVEHVEQIFNNANLNFSEFANEVSETNGISANAIEKCIDFENTDDTLKNIAKEEMEFSDTEDMLEGIKVSIEDSCDDVDGLRGHWFGGSSYQGITTVSGTLAQILSADQIHTEEMEEECTIKREPLLRFTDNQKLVDYSTYCSDKLRSLDQIDNSIPKQNKEINASYSEDTMSSLNDLDLPTSNLNTCSIKTVKRNEKSFFCPDCKREFNSGNALKYHMQIHSGIRPHQCDICGRSFFARGALISHIRTHTGEKPFECEICQQRFRQWGDLKYHKTSIHSEEKSYQCEFCGKSFSRKYSLVVHIRIHENIRNYKCEFCGKAFRASTYLQNHRRIHTGEKPHGCKTCGKHFRVYGDLRRHLRIHQRNDIQQTCKTTTDTNQTQISSSAIKCND